jgi:hypothetical protein
VGAIDQSTSVNGSKLARADAATSWVAFAAVRLGDASGRGVGVGLRVGATVAVAVVMGSTVTVTAMTVKVL